MASVNPKIFRAYDIRGIYPDEIDESAAYQIGRAFAVYLIKTEAEKPEKIVIGRDPRISSPILARTFINGIIDTGLDVMDIGMVTVDMVYFASGSMHLPAAMITASHNPKEYNGFKLMKKDISFFDIKDLKIIIDKNERVDLSRKGKIVEGSVKDTYLRHVLSFIDIDAIKPMKVVIDTGSGTAGPILRLLLEKLPLQYRAMNFNPDGNFPHHGPNPMIEENILDLKNEMAINHYCFGCVFDCDGDRIIFVDEKGETIRPSVFGALIAKYFLNKNPRNKIIYNATVGQIVPDVINIYGGQSIREKVGHVYIQNRLKKEDGILGIEASAHYFFKKNFFTDSGIISLMVMLDILSRQNKHLSVLVKEFDKYAAIPETNFRVEDPAEFIKKIARNFEGCEIDWLDGLTVKTADFWLNLRPSNTEPLVRLNIEAKDELILERVKKDIFSLIEKFK